MLTWNCTHLYSSFFENAIRDAVTYTEGVGVQCGKCKVEYNSCNTLDNGRLDGGGGSLGIVERHSLKNIEADKLEKRGIVLIEIFIFGIHFCLLSQSTHTVPCTAYPIIQPEHNINH